MEALEKHKSEIKAICDLAIAGAITIAEFYRRWPKDLEGSKFADLLHEDLEEGIQHFPAHLFSGKPDLKLWTSSDMYRRLVIASAVLATDLSESDLLEIRAALTRNRKLSYADIPKEIEAFVRAKR